MTSVITSIIKIPDLLDKLGKRIAAACQQIQNGREQWMAGTLDLASALAEAKTCFPSNKAFGEWLAANGFDRIGHQDRAALINMASAQAIETTRVVLSETERWSWRYIWEYEIEPRLTCAGKTAEAVPPAVPTAPAAVPIPASPIAKHVAKFKKWSDDTKAIQDSDGVSEKAAELMSDLIALLDRVIKELEATT